MLSRSTLHSLFLTYTSQVPEAILMFYNSFVIINHSNKTLRIVALSVHQTGGNVSEAYQASVARIEELLARLNQRRVRLIVDHVNSEGSP